MIRGVLIKCIIASLLMHLCLHVSAQQPGKDTFFLAKKKGLLGRLGRSVSVDNPQTTPVKTVNPFLRYASKRINSIEVVRLDFNRSLHDSLVKRDNFPIRVANALHLNTRERVVRNNLFFRAGDVLYPYMLSDNERFLREQEFIQDALIVVLPSPESNQQVDVVVIVRDVFSIGGKINLSSTDRMEVELKEENFAGSGTKISVKSLYDAERNPSFGFGAELIRRNIRGSFINWTLGALNFRPAFNSGKNEELNVYTYIERPMFSRYTAWTGAMELELNNSTNRYHTDSLFKTDFRYQYLRSDFWVGYNIGHKRQRLTDHTNRLRHFISGRLMYNHFLKKPEKYSNEYNFSYADVNGGLLGYSLYRQNFYKTNFIYGFGRNEDIPEGLDISATGGWINKSGQMRAYFGVGAEVSRLFRRGNYYSAVLRAGTFRDEGEFEDTDVLMEINHFSALHTLSSKWRNRNFFKVGFAKQFSPVLNTPLFLVSNFGLPYFSGDEQGSFRTTVRTESVYYHLRKFLGFRFAPFAFGDFAMITPRHEDLKASRGYTAIGGGFRTRNENLVFGTLEFRGAYYPRTLPGMKNYEFTFSSNIKFKYNSTFIRRPDFIINN